MRPGSLPAPGDVARLRSRIYLLLAEAFSPPTPRALRRLTGGRARRRARAPAWLGVIPSLAAALSGVERCVSALPRRSPRARVALLREQYLALFVGPYALEAPPWESCYRTPAGGVMGEAAVAVGRCYAAAGLGLEPDARLLPDHVACEMEFLGRLAAMETALWTDGASAALSACLGHQRRFLAEHLGAWIPSFAERVRGAGRSPFYAALATATADFVTGDAGLVAALEEAAA